MKKLIFIMILITCFTVFLLCGDNTEEEAESDNQEEEFYDIINNIYVDESQIRDTSTNEDDDVDKPFPEVSEEDFKNGMAIINVNDKYGFINQDREIVIQPLYDNVGDEGFENGLARVSLEGKWGFIDLDGNTAINLEYDYASPFNEEELAEVSKNDKFMTIDKEGNIVKENDEDLNIDYTNLLSQRFAVERSSVKIKVVMKNGTASEETITYRGGKRYIILTEPQPKTFMWNIPIDYSGNAKTSLVFRITEDNVILLAIASNDIILTQEGWDDIESSPIMIEREGLLLKKIFFKRKWKPDLDNERMKSISIDKDSYIDIKLISSTEEENQNSGDQNLDNLYIQKIPVSIDDFVHVYVINIIKFDIKQDIVLIEANMLGDRRFIQLIGLKSLFREKTVEYLEDKILYNYIYLEKDNNLPDNYNEYIYPRYVWTELPEPEYDNDLNIYILKESDIKSKLLNYLLIKKGLVIPSLNKNFIKKYDFHLIEAYKNRDIITASDNQEDSISTPSSRMGNTNDDNNTENVYDYNNDESSSELTVDDYDDYYSYIDESDSEPLIEDTTNNSISGNYVYDYCSIDCLISQRTGSLCKDGTFSESTGRGACSGHGGVECWLCIY